jgi:hypothetical protein
VRVSGTRMERTRRMREEAAGGAPTREEREVPAPWGCGGRGVGEGGRAGIGR